MKWKLWVDDDLNNPIAPERHTPDGFIGCETAEEAIAAVKKHGFANLQFMDLDHDLGTYEDGSIRDVKKFVKWLAETYPDGPVPNYNVHSRNPPGKEWTESFLDSWKRSLAA